MTDIKSKLMAIMSFLALCRDEALLMAEHVAQPLRDGIDENIDNQFAARQAQSAVTTLVVVGATLIVGLIVYSKIEESTPNPENSDLNNSTQSVNDTVASAFDLGSVLPIVIIAGAILFFLSGFGRGGGGMMRR